LIVPDIMEVDAAQYASISMQMAETNSFLEVYHLAGNYLDKPPLLFWFGAIFIKMFGVNHLAYRLPTFLTTILGTYATYALGKRIYNKNTGIIAAITIASAQVYILHNHDVRTDTLLTNFVIIAIWQGVTYLQTKTVSSFIFAFIAVGMAMLAKGPIGAVVPVMALGTHLVYQRSWANLFNWRWILGILIVLFVLTPMMYGLYMQFDANPEAMVNGRTNVSGLRFFFWEQSFGRITGENVWKDDSSYFFFTHNYLWEFLPWSLIGIAAFYSKIRRLVLDRFSPNNTNEMYTIGGFIFPFIALSTSQYKLPHYIMVIMPLAAIFTAGYIDTILKKESKREYKTFKWIQLVFAFLLGFLALFIMYWVFPEAHAFWWLIPLGIFTSTLFIFTHSNPLVKLIGPSVAAVIFMNILMNGLFYPQLNNYQSGKLLADWINANDIQKDDIGFLNHHYHNTYFYSGEYQYRFTNANAIKEIIKKQDYYVYTDNKGLTSLKNANITYKVVADLFNFPNAELTVEFLNAKTRTKALQDRYVIMVEKQD
ncbi:MAG: 4-amino-4-deoxy-L-arabinose transferase-like glycosyltransferase, partial [Salibacteraceae bacterium]